VKTALKTSLLVAILLGLGESEALAQETAPSGLGFGVRAGLGLDPDQFVVGGQFTLGAKAFSLARIVPSVDIGFGDNVTTFAFNADLLFRFILEGTSFGLYGGGGPTLAYWDVSNSSSSSWDFGLSLTVGAQVPIFKTNATNIEGRFGIGDIPDFRLLFAFIF
jgi:hypothetical protein